MNNQDYDIQFCGVGEAELTIPSGKEVWVRGILLPAGAYQTRLPQQSDLVMQTDIQKLISYVRDYRSLLNEYQGVPDILEELDDFLKLFNHESQIPS